MQERRDYYQEVRENVNALAEDGELMLEHKIILLDLIAHYIAGLREVMEERIRE